MIFINFHRINDVHINNYFLDFCRTCYFHIIYNLEITHCIPIIYHIYK